MQIEFSVMGLDYMANEYLNWCMEHRDNLEFLKETKMLELRSANANVHFSDLGRIEIVEKNIKHKRKKDV